MTPNCRDEICDDVIDASRDIAVMRADMRHLCEQLSEIKADVKALLAWRNKMLGMAAAAGLVAGSVVSLVFKAVA